MKLLVFAHVPPPHHGQSYMVKLMLDGFGGDHRRGASAQVRHSVECYHVNVRLSKRLEDIGDLRFGKFVLLLLYCLQAIWCRFRYGVENFYYVPAPGKTSALVRDWMVMLICRPFFKRFILHWHAAGLAKWLETCTQIRSRSFTYALMKDMDMSIVLSKYNRADAEKLFPKRISVVSNGIPDPCPAFEQDILPRRNARLEARRRLLAGERLTGEEQTRSGNDPQIVHVLYLAHCTREKGAFDAMAGTALANKKIAEIGTPVTFRLTVTGSFVTAEDRAEFETLMQKPEVANCVEYAGFVSGEEKEKLLRNADVFCFPTFYPNENQPVNLIEAMAYGLPVLTTHWRSLPEIFPRDYPGLVDVRSLPQIADALLRLITEDGESLRDLFLKNFTIENYLSGLSDAFHKAEQDTAQTAPTPVPTT
ncbi:MAG TPA: glycosyltransferase [Verrucomicrobiae bacterium]|nr:glycosyltransferase [Verrucomicrobiae bacterium]